MLLVDPELADQLDDVDAPQKFVIGAESDALLYRHDLEPTPWEPDEDATATINYTSGTTARPKGVEMTHRNLWVNAATFGWQAGVNDRDVYLHTLPMFHCNGWGMPYTVAAMGVPQVVLRKVDGSEILRRVARPRRHLHVRRACRGGDDPRRRRELGRADPRQRGRRPPPGAHHRRRRTAADADHRACRDRARLGVHPDLRPDRDRSAAHHEPRHAPSGTICTPAERARKLVRAGAPALGVRLRVDDEGELLARGNTVLKSYWDQPAETAAALDGGWFHTGDGGIIDDEHHVTIHDRKKDVIISGGENVSSIEVEDVLFSHPAVAEVAVIGVPDEKWGETIKALVVLAPGADASAADLIQHCRDHIAHYKCPTSVEFRDELSRTATGKLQKFKLREPYWAGRDRQVN